MPDSSPDDWLSRLKQTMALDLSIAMQSQMPPKACIEFLFRIPEVREAFHLRERSNLDIDIDTPEGQAIAAERIEWVAAFLDDGFHESTVEELRTIAADLLPDGPRD
jgi:hypothetical protein